MNSSFRFAALLFVLGILFSEESFAQPDTARITRKKVAAAQELLGLDFTRAEQDSMLGVLKEYLTDYDSLHKFPIPNGLPPALVFDPIPTGFSFKPRAKQARLGPMGRVKMPANTDDLAFYSVRELGELVRTRQISSTALTRFFIARLKKYSPMLLNVVNWTAERALDEAGRADAEIAAGRYRGPLHGIPYGAKDILAAKGYPTTWGSAIFKDRMIDEDAAVVRKLSEAGAVLVAKLTVGEFAWGDVWFDGMTRNPWDTAQGSSGSSAGSASAVAAGCLPFAIGTETWGSIVSPSSRCGATGLRPTFGRVSRAGAMALSWSMDKIGPICRTVEDCAIVFDAIRGPDGIDRAVRDYPFNYPTNVSLKKLRIGYLKKDMDKDTSNAALNQAVLETFRQKGLALHEIELPNLGVFPMSFILTAEAAAAFDEITRTNQDDRMVRQIKDAWPNYFRASRFIPAVEYIQANRLRRMVIDEMQKLMDSIDVYIAPPFEGDNLLLTNLTGHPCVVLPNGFDKDGHPTSITFVGRLYDEAAVLAVAKAYQDATDFHKKHPKGF
ncbi:MAG: amidase [candidate division Zixibacteria bacterium]|nr:amidase [candidate division Zixibacteria bacterium]MCI0596571.1 amidase [candidate division Zixibacteria bacterium]